MTGYHTFHQLYIVLHFKGPTRIWLWIFSAKYCTDIPGFDSFPRCLGVCSFSFFLFFICSFKLNMQLLPVALSRTVSLLALCSVSGWGTAHSLHGSWHRYEWDVLSLLNGHSHCKWQASIRDHRKSMKLQLTIGDGAGGLWVKLFSISS